MKQYILPLLLCFAYSGITQGQEKGKTSVEAFLNPASLFDGNAGPLFEMPYIKARFFLQEDLAFRIGTQMKFNSTTTHPFNEADNIEKNSAFTISLMPAMEKHLGSGKFSPYIGAGIPLEFTTSKGKRQIGNQTVITKKVWIDGSNPAYISFGLKGIVGCDFYVTDNFFLGFEFNSGFSYLKNLEQENNVSGTTTTIPSSSSLSFTLESFAWLRVGVRF